MSRFFPKIQLCNSAAKDFDVDNSLFVRPNWIGDSRVNAADGLSYGAILLPSMIPSLKNYLITADARLLIEYPVDIIIVRPNIIHFFDERLKKRNIVDELLLPWYPGIEYGSFACPRFTSALAPVITISVVFFASFFWFATVIPICFFVSIAPIVSVTMFSAGGPFPTSVW